MLARHYLDHTVILTKSRIDLTSASRAYLMEPHWNPHVEEQALARIHRMGQTREVTTVRFVMNGSFEEVYHPFFEQKDALSAYLLLQHMVKVQNRKSQLAGLVFAQKRVSDGEINMSRIHVSRIRLVLCRI